MFALGKRITSGLALGGGGAKGLAHLGVLRVLERNNIPIDIITGTSAGAVVGAMYAQLGSIDKVESRLRKFLTTDFLDKIHLDLVVPPKDAERQKLLGRISFFAKQQYVLARSFSRMSFFGPEVLGEGLAALLDDKDITETQIPFGAVTVDYLSGERVILTRGSIRKAVTASCSIPGMFPPVPWDGMLFMDGTVVSKVPVIEAHEIGANFVIGVSVSPGMRKDLDIRNGLELMFRADEITENHLNLFNMRKADVIIHPDLGRIHWADFKNSASMISIGKEATEKQMREIKRKLGRKKFYVWER